MAELLADFITKTFPAQPYIIGRSVLPVKGKCILAGSPKTGKSFVALNLALDLVRGRNLFGAEYKSGTPLLPVGRPWRVLYLEMELGEVGLLERLIGQEGKAGLVTGISAPGLELYLQTRDTSMRIDTPQGRDFIEQIIQACKPDVTIFDPLAKFHLSDENSSQETGALMRVVDHWIEDYGTAALVIHHISKQDPDPNKQKRGGDRLRGSSALFADTDTLLEVTRLSSEHAREPVLKFSFELRRGEPVEDLFFRRRADGHIEWLGSEYSFESPKGDKFPKSRFHSL